MAKSKVQLFKDPINGKLYSVKGERVRQYPAGTTIHRNGQSSRPFTSEKLMSDSAQRNSWISMVGLVSVSV